jgi:hypothetical protein
MGLRNELNTSLFRRVPDEGISEDGSELTSGAVLCGNPCKALSRRQAGKLSSSSKLARMMVAQVTLIG